MLLHCHSRKCNTTRDFKLKVAPTMSASEVICMDCGETNNMVSDFMKNAMKGSGDVYRAVQGRKAFMYKCPRCAIDRGVKIVDEQALCESCLHPLNLSAPMIEAIKTTSGSTTAAKEAAEDDVAPKSELTKGVIKRHKS